MTNRYEADEYEDYDEIEEYLARDYLNRNNIRMGIVIFGAVCISIGMGFYLGTGAGWLVMGIIAILGVILSRGSA